ncbi:hypothetical protein [Clostridium neonatale]|nr:hypothetical protein [Clostridium neonatale]
MSGVVNSAPVGVENLVSQKKNIQLRKIKQNSKHQNLKEHF